MITSNLACAAALVALTSAPQEACNAGPQIETIGGASMESPLQLEAVGLPLIGMPFALQVTEGPAGAHGCVLYGVGESPLSLGEGGGIFHPGLPVYPILFDLDADGASPLLLDFVSADEDLCGVEFVAQAVIVDDGAPAGLLMSDALRVRFGLATLSGPLVDAPISTTADASVLLSGVGTTPGNTIVVQGGAEVEQAVVGPSGMFLVDVDLDPNSLNVLYVREIDASGVESPAATVEVIQDSQPPEVFIDFPLDGDEFSTATINVSGRVSDTLSGFAGLHVDVNGLPAVVDIGIGTNGTFDLADLSIDPSAPTTIVAVATDAVGNTASDTVVVEFVDLDGLFLKPLGGGNQVAPVNSPLPAPIEIEITDGAGGSLPGKLVTFEVIKSDGRLASTPGAGGELVFQTFTDSDGRAAAYWTLGSDAGCGNNRVRVTSLDAGLAVYFCASAEAGLPSQVNVASGNNQTALIGSTAPLPLQSWVNDGCNGVGGVAVTYTVVQGGGTIAAGAFAGAQSIVLGSTVTGHSAVEFTVGLDPGGNVVEADFAGNPGEPARFLVKAIEPDAGGTGLEGVVLDNSLVCIEGATCVLEFAGGESETVLSGADGSFRFDGLTTSGLAHLFVDGSTAVSLAGQPIDPAALRFPALEYELLILAGAENDLPAPVLLPRLDPANDEVYDGSSEVVLTVEGIEGLEMLVAAGTVVTLPDGTVASAATPVTLALNQVHVDEVPMPMTDGAAPPFAWTLQPAGATFDPPVQVTYPNMSGLPPGAVSFFLSFDHETGAFEIVASGEVSSDGSVIRSDEGDGISVAGWGCNCPPYSVVGECKNCFELAVPLFKGGPSSLGSSVGAGVKALAKKLRAIDPDKITTKVIGSGNTASAQLNPAKQWLKEVGDDECPDPAVMLIGHSLGGDTVRLSGEIAAVERIALDPIARSLALKFPNSCQFYQRDESFSGASGITNLLAEDLTEAEQQECAEVALKCLAKECLRGYLIPNAVVEGIVVGSDHSSVVPKSETVIIDKAKAIVGATDAEGEEALVFLDENFVLSVAGQQFQVSEDGLFVIGNVPAADEFGPSGPGTAPDFVSDDYLRVTGVGVVEGKTYYAFSEPFKITQGQTAIIEGITITENPPPLPTAIDLDLGGGVITALGQTVQAVTTATLADGSTLDVTSNDQWTNYKTSNPAIATVDEDGLVEAAGDGVAYITATNDGAASVAQVIVSIGDLQTEVVGLVQLGDGTPVGGAQVEVLVQGQVAISGAGGQFSIPSVLAGLGSIIVQAEVELDGVVYRGAAGPLKGLEGGLTDAGILVLEPSGGVVGYYDMSVNGGVASQAPPIAKAGLDAVAIGDLGSADLSTIDIFFVQNPSNSFYSSAFLGNLDKVFDFVEQGGVMVFHDRLVDGAEAVLPGRPGIAVRDFSDEANIDVLVTSTQVTLGPGGVVDDSTLDGGNSSSHGFVVEDSIPDSGLGILSRTADDELVLYSYAHGAGWVVYSSIPLDYYLAGSGSPTLAFNFAEVYAPNVLGYADFLDLTSN